MNQPDVEKAAPDSKPPKVFISYSHDSPEHMDRVLELSNRLRDDGIDCTVDQYETSPPQGWPRWCEDQLEQADYVLVACTEKYRQRFRAKEERGKGLGVKWEGAVITQDIYDAEANNTRFIPVTFTPEDAAYIPTVLRGATRYELEGDYEKLYRHITGQPLVLKPQLGKRKSLPPLARQQSFSSYPEKQAEAVGDASVAQRGRAPSEGGERPVLYTSGLNKMRPFLIVAVQVVVFLFAAFGGFLKEVAPPEQSNPKFAVGFSSFLVLIVLLIVSAVSKEAPTDKFRRRWIVAGIVFFVLAVVSGLLYPWTLDKLTYDYPPPPDAAEARHIRGLTLTKKAEDFIARHPDKESPGQLELNLPYEVIWTADSVSKAKMLLNLNYIALVLSIASAVFCLLEVNLKREHAAGAGGNRTG